MEGRNVLNEVSRERGRNYDGSWKTDLVRQETEPRILLRRILGRQIMRTG
jgi:hypothetical protein